MYLSIEILGESSSEFSQALVSVGIVPLKDKKRSLEAVDSSAKINALKDKLDSIPGISYIVKYCPIVGNDGCVGEIDRLDHRDGLGLGYLVDWGRSAGKEWISSEEISYDPDMKQYYFKEGYTSKHVHMSFEDQEQEDLTRWHFISDHGLTKRPPARPSTRPLGTGWSKKRDKTKYRIARR